MTRKKILMPVLDAGAGHRMPAIAVKEAIESLRPGAYEIDVIDFAHASGAFSDDRKMKSFWDYCLSHPRGARFFYSLMEALRFLNPLVVPVYLSEAVRKGREYLRAYKPDAIFSTHYFAMSIAALARNSLKLPAKVVCYVTDPFDAFTFWCDKRSDLLIVASEKARARAVKHGYPAAKAMVLPFPINAKFLRPTPPRESTLRALGLDPARKTLIATQGGQGIGTVTGYIMDIYRRGLPLNVIVVCGKNQAAKTELEAFRDSMPSLTALCPLGFVDNMHELLRAGDLLIAKAGASTTFEALFCGIPTVFTSWAIQSERPNVEYCVENGAGWFAPDAKAFWEVVDLALSTDVLERYRRNIASLHIESGSEKVAKVLIDFLERPGT